MRPRRQRDFHRVKLEVAAHGLSKLCGNHQQRLTHFKNTCSAFGMSLGHSTMKTRRIIEQLPQLSGPGSKTVLVASWPLLPHCFHELCTPSKIRWTASYSVLTPLLPSFPPSLFPHFQITTKSYIEAEAYRVCTRAIAYTKMAGRKMISGPHLRGSDQCFSQSHHQPAIL